MQLAEQRGVAAAGAGPGAILRRIETGRWREIHASSSRFAGPVSKPDTFGAALEHRDVGDAAEIERSRDPRRRCGIPGRGTPVAAGPPGRLRRRSRRRKSATTSMPVISARVLGSPICQVNGRGRSGRWRNVCPWLPMAVTGRRIHALPRAAAASAAVREGLRQRQRRSGRFHRGTRCPGASTRAAIRLLSPGSNGVGARRNAATAARHRNPPAPRRSHPCWCPRSGRDKRLMAKWSAFA